MNTNMDKVPDRNDILGRRLSERQEPIFPAELGNRIMLKVNSMASRRKMRNTIFRILAIAGGAAALAAVTYFALSYSGIDLRPLLSIDTMAMEGISESFKALDTPAVKLAAGAFAVGIFYLSLNGILSGRARRKALLKER